MSPHDQLQKTLELIRLERTADLELYRQKVMLRSLTQRTQDGTTWYPVRLKSYWLGTGERLTVEIERTHHLEQPHSFQSGKNISLFSNTSGKPDKEHANGVINYVRENTMVLTLNVEEIPDWIDDRLLGVDVMFDEMTYREMEFALKEVMKAEGRVAEFRDLLLGDKRPTFEQVQHAVPLSGLNTVQMGTVQKILAAKDIAIIHGPPGTGKTTTLAEAINLTIKKEKQVLVCAPSNAAVDLLTEKLFEKGLDVIRIGHPARVTEQSLEKTLDARIARHSNFPELRALRKKMEHTKSMALKFKRNFGYAEKQQRRQLLSEAKALKADADVLEFYIINDLLLHCQAICSTLIGASHPVLRGRKFGTVFIDEAGQALEPACWVPLLRSSRVIFAGDHQQLPPTIKSHEAGEKGLAITLFEKAIRKEPASATMLQVQYRMNEAIMKFPSGYFYDNKLVADESVRAAMLRPNQLPVEFLDTAGCGFEEVQDPETLSRSNQEEGRILIQRIEKLIEEVGIEEWVEEKITVGIIAPYSAQIEYLRRLTDSSPVFEQLGRLISVNTVDGFQGQERDVIGISFVRSNTSGDIGFLRDIRRTNVAMTRARKKLIMVGDSATLGTNPFYLELLEYVQKGEFYESAFGL